MEADEMPHSEIRGVARPFDCLDRWSFFFGVAGAAGCKSQISNLRTRSSFDFLPARRSMADHASVILYISSSRIIYFSRQSAIDHSNRITNDITIATIGSMASCVRKNSPQLTAVLITKCILPTPHGSSTIPRVNNILLLHAVCSISNSAILGSTSLQWRSPLHAIDQSTVLIGKSLHIY